MTLTPEKINTVTLGGYAGQILRVNMTTGKIAKEPLSHDVCEDYIGGRGRDALTIFNEVPADADPLGPENILCLSTGPITGLLGPTTGRVNTAALSPLTGIYGNSNAGTNWGPELKYAGYDGIIVQGKSKQPYYLFIDDDKVELRSAKHLWGKGVFDTIRALKQECGEDIFVAAVGQAAENGVLFSTIIFDFWDACGRGGMGTVMASKGLKAIAVRGSGAIKVANPKKYMSIAREGWDGVLNDPGFKIQRHPTLGTAICVHWGNAQGWLPTRNFREAHFESANKIDGWTFLNKYSTKEAPLPGGRACMSCPNRCKRFGRIESGKYAGTHGNIEFEGIGAFGSKCGIDDLEAVFHAFMLANDYGMDCIACGNTIATFMELNQQGLLPEEVSDGLDFTFGNAESMIEAVHRIAQRKGKLGELGGLGSARAVKIIAPDAVDYAMTVKGNDTIACDPRVAKGFGFTYAISSRGSDHLRAHPVFEMIAMPKQIGKEMFGSEEAVELTKYGGKVNMVFWHENLGAVTDSIGSCRFMHASYYAQYPIPELLHKINKSNNKPHSIKYHEWLTAATGIKYTYEDLLKAGERIITIERAINLRRGIRKKDDTLPKRFFEEPVPKGPSKGQIFDKKMFDLMIVDYYQKRGWDIKEGLILKNKLKELGMNDVCEKLRKEKLISP
ncbi:MAG: aldehyde ferredoxin oxidoreductase family protein [Planctomycetes bacterium]|nr:aldehyde ferredoxin oxidoreductase family protein [Planctomycetota bacterium]